MELRSELLMEFRRLEVKDALYWNSPLNRMTYSPLTLENYLALAKSKL